MHTAFDLFLSPELLQIFPQTPELLCGQMEESCEWHQIRERSVGWCLIDANNTVVTVTDVALTGDTVNYRRKTWQRVIRPSGIH